MKEKPPQLKNWFTKSRVYKLIVLFLVLDIYIAIIPFGFPSPHRTLIDAQEKILDKETETNEDMRYKKIQYFKRKEPQKLTIFDAYGLYYGVYTIDNDREYSIHLLDLKDKSHKFIVVLC